LNGHTLGFHPQTQSLCCASDTVASVEREDHTQAMHADLHLFFLLEYKYINTLSVQAQSMNSLPILLDCLKCQLWLQIFQYFLKLLKLPLEVTQYDQEGVI